MSVAGTNYTLGFSSRKKSDIKTAINTAKKVGTQVNNQLLRQGIDDAENITQIKKDILLSQYALPEIKLSSCNVRRRRSRLSDICLPPDRLEEGLRMTGLASINLPENMSPEALAQIKAGLVKKNKKVQK